MGCCVSCGCCWRTTVCGSVSLLLTIYFYRSILTSSPKLWNQSTAENPVADGANPPESSCPAFVTGVPNVYELNPRINADFEGEGKFQEWEAKCGSQYDSSVTVAAEGGEEEGGGGEWMRGRGGGGMRRLLERDDARIRTRQYSITHRVPANMSATRMYGRVYPDGYVDARGGDAMEM